MPPQADIIPRNEHHTKQITKTAAVITIPLRATASTNDNGNDDTANDHISINGDVSAPVGRSACSSLVAKESVTLT